MPTNISTYYWRRTIPDDFWNQCDGPMGEHGGLRFVPGATDSAHVLSINPPVPKGARHTPRGLFRRWLKWRGDYETAKINTSLDLIRRPPSAITMLVFEPPNLAPDAWYQMAPGRIARVYGPDPRATHPIRMPAFWQIDATVSALRAMEIQPKAMVAAAIHSGADDTPGRSERVEFLRRLRRAQVPMTLFGRHLPTDLAPLGELRAKTTALLPAMFTISIENYAEGDLYVSEKIWDPLLCWSLPLYHGSRAADHMIPHEAFIRLPDLGDGGVEAVKAALRGGEGLWRSRLGAIAEARRRILGDLRMVEWARRTMQEIGVIGR